MTTTWPPPTTRRDPYPRNPHPSLTWQWAIWEAIMLSHRYNCRYRITAFTQDDEYGPWTYTLDAIPHGPETNPPQDPGRDDLRNYR